MPQVLIHFDDATLKAIDRIAPAAKRKRADFIRQAVKDAIFRQETDRMREAIGSNRTPPTVPTLGISPRNGRNEAVRDLVGGPAGTSGSAPSNT